MALGITGRLLVANASPVPALTGPELAQRLQDRQRAIVDLSARFVQTYRSGAMGREVVERGTLVLKRPGRMRWEYQEPEKKTFVTDGKTVYFYVPADHQVIVKDQTGDRGLALGLLTGSIDLLDRFEATIADGPGGVSRLRLTPRKPDADVDHVFVDLDATYRVRSLDIIDIQGNRSQFRFEDVRENAGVADRLFHFEIPRGVEVIAG